MFESSETRYAVGFLCAPAGECSTTVVKEQHLPSFWLKKEKSTGHFMADLTEWPCLLRVPTNLLMKDGEGMAVSGSWSGLDIK